MKLWNLFGVVPLLLCKAIAGESTNTIKNGIVPSVNGKRPSASGHRPIDNHLSIPIHPMTELRHKLNIFHSTPLNKWLQRFDMQFGGTMSIFIELLHSKYQLHVTMQMLHTIIHITILIRSVGCSVRIYWFVGLVDDDVVLSSALMLWWWKASSILFKYIKCNPIS